MIKNPLYKLILGIVLLLFGSILHCQNLVPNGDFEEYKFRPKKNNQLHNNVDGWKNGVAWTTPDFYLQEDKRPKPTSYFKDRIHYSPYSGHGFVGLLPVGLGGEAIQIELFDSLEKDSVYVLSFYIQLSEGASFAIDRFQIDFGEKEEDLLQQKFFTYKGFFKGYADWAFGKQLGDYKSIYAFKNEAKDFFMETGEWQKVSVIYKANGGEKFMRIGNLHQCAYLRNTSQSSQKDMLDKKEIKKMRKLHKKLIVKKKYMNFDGAFCYYLVDNVSLYKTIE